MTSTLGMRIRSRFSIARERIAHIENIVADLKTCAGEGAAREPSARRAETGAPQAAHAGAADGALDILIIEDEKYLANSLELILADHHVTVACDSRAAVALCAQRDYDVILCDLWMSGLTGMDVHRELLRHRPGQERRMVFMTGGAFTARAQQFLDSVPNPILQKPFSTEELLQVVASGRRGGGHLPAA